ncbi:MAG: LacI family DNA-binding transcriptional regulator [Spirochaetaceae bacterium]
MDDRVTLETVAKEAGVSQSTVSRVLNQPSKVNERTRRDVYAALDRHGYRPRAQVRDTDARKYIIGVAIHDFHLSLFADLFRALEDELSPSTYDLMIINMRGERDVHAFFRNHSEYRDKIDALIAFSATLEREGADYLESIGMPVVLMQGRCQHAKSISTNNFLGGHDAAAHLLACGYQKPAFVGWRRRDHRLTARYSGFRTALEEAGIDAATLATSYKPLSVEGGYAAAEELFSGPATPPDSIFFACDSMAIGGLRYLRRAGVQVPGSVGVIGFDDIEAASAVGLTTMKQFIDRKAHMAISYLLSRLEGAEREVDFEEVSISPLLVQRETTEMRKNRDIPG